ncbi:MAG: hypothetical protein JWL59_2949 [Chthoniobacteraceae bacterium]|nr:hypothetical protein [Chthoniobacteraceae bacterium]
MTAQQRSRIVVTILFVTCLGFVGMELDRRELLPWRNYSHATGRQSEQPPGKLVEPSQVPEDVAARIKDFTARISEAATAMNPNERKALLATQRVFAPLVPKMAAYEGAVKMLNDAGITSPATLVSQETLRERITMIKRLKQANHALLEFYRNIEKNYQQELGKEKLPLEVKKDAMGGFRRGASIEANLAVRECDEQIQTTRLQILEFLDREWGAWKVQPAGELAFEHDSALSEYMALQETLRLTSQRQQAAQKELITRSEPRPVASK